MFAGTRTEYVQAMVECMKGRGVSARFEVSPEGGPSVAVDSAATGKDEDPGQVAWEECTAALPSRPEPGTDADYRAMYDKRVTETRCVQELGHEAPPVPSWQSFLEVARAQQVEWDPTALVPDQLRSSVRRTCTDQDSWW